MNEEQIRRITARITARAWGDPAFKERLLADPATVLREHGRQIPEEITVHIHENTATDRHIILPLRPEGLLRRDLADPSRLMVAYTHHLELPQDRLSATAPPAIEIAKKSATKTATKAPGKKLAKKAAKKPAKKTAKKSTTKKAPKRKG